MSSFHHALLKKSGRRMALRWFVLLAFLAMTMNLLASAGFVHSLLMRGDANGTNGLFVGEICTVAGSVKSPLATNDSAPASGTAMEHACCGVCVAGGAAPTSDIFDGVSAAPTGEFLLSVSVSVRPALMAAKRHRPRGPPIV